MEQDDIIEYLLQADQDAALKRVKDAIDRPTACDCCGAPVRLVNNKVVYGKQYGEWPLMYLCTSKPCQATVGCHPQTTIPLGRMADKGTRYLRTKVHKLIDPLWRGIKRPGLRTSVYRRLAADMGIPMRECHVGMFSAEQCKQAIGIVKGWEDGSGNRKTG